MAEKLWKNCSKKEHREIAAIQKKSDTNHKLYRDGLIGKEEYENTKKYLLCELERCEKKYES